MVEMSGDLLDWEVGFVTKLANHLFSILPSRVSTAVTKVGFFLRDFLESVARQMKTCVAGVAIEHLVGVVVETAETDFTVGFKKLFGGCCIFAFDGFENLLSFDELVELL